MISQILAIAIHKYRLQKNIMDIKRIKTVGVIGGGTMGQGIIQNFAEAGLNVIVFDVDHGQLDLCLKQIEANLKLFKNNLLLKEKVPYVLSRISTALIDDLETEIGKCDFFLESVPEKIELKRQIFARLDICKKDVILASNTSSLTVDAIAANMKTPERVIGVHYFNPAHIMPLVEIHYGSKTSEGVIALTKELMLNVGKEVIIVKKALPGLIVNRIAGAMGREIESLLDKGIVTPEEIDIAARACYGFRASVIGPIEGYDMIGLDILAAVGKSLYPTLDNSDLPPQFLYDKVQRGELGVKSGKGYYDYTGKSRARILDQQNFKLLRQLALYREIKEFDKN